MNTPKIRVGIVGYGNLGKGVETALGQDMELAGVFSRRHLDHPRYHPAEELPQWQDEIDVLLLCGGSALDLPRRGPRWAGLFHTVDSFDTHACIPEYFSHMDAAARRGGKISLISTGWDPGLFSLIRVLGEAVLPHGEVYTFWGRGVSQGHSDALRRIPGVADARQYTVPSAEALARVRAWEMPTLSTREKHRRECHVVLEPGADAERVRQEIVNMPNYFADYDTTVNFISQETLDKEHGGYPHGGLVCRTGATGPRHRGLLEFRLELDSNPEFTGSVLVACARAVARLAARGEIGGRTLLDIPVGMLAPQCAEELRAAWL